MPQDEKLNDRIRRILSDRDDVTERKMFGGLCFMLSGNMLCGCDAKYGLIIRVGPEAYASALELKHAREMDITGKPMKGFVLVDPMGVETKTSLTRWIQRGIAFVDTLPPKKPKEQAS